MVMAAATNSFRTSSGWRNIDRVHAAEFYLPDHRQYPELKFAFLIVDRRSQLFGPRHFSGWAICYVCVTCSASRSTRRWHAHDLLCPSSLLL